MPLIETFVLGPSSPEISVCANWRVEAFGNVLGADFAAEKKSLESFVAEQDAQVALIAKRNGELAGTCLLVRSEIEPCHQLTPWLAGLYVAPEHRRCGVGAALVSAIEAQARKRGHRRLYPYTDGGLRYYERLGWRAIDSVDWKGFSTNLMAREL